MQSTSVCFKRLQKDFEDLKKHPLIGCSASPLPNDLTLWHGNIIIPLKINNKTQKLPIHLLIEFSEKYPINAPDVGFCTVFPYRMGLSLTARSGRIKGLYELCLNILGNLSKVHTEWQSQVGEGWSAGMSVSTLLVNLQSILLDLDNQLSVQEKKDLINDLNKFTMEIKDGNWSVKHTVQNPWPELPKEQPVKQEKPKYEIYKAMLANERPVIDEFLIKKAKLNEELQKEFYLLVGGILERNNVVLNSEGNEEGKAEEQKVEKLQKIKEEIFCYVSGMSFEDGILGFGIYKDRNLISTYAELLSYSQFKQGYRQSSNKSQFSNFIPAYICPQHAEKDNNWKIVTKNCMKAITDLLNMQGCSFKDAALWILPKLINSMIVEMKKNSKAQAIAFFEAMCSFWRTLRFFYTNTDGLQDAAVKMIKDFTNSETQRHKDVNPDVGVILAIATTVTDKINFSEFIDAYLDESFIRCVMWWNKGANSKEKNNVFKQTEVSRELLLFQLLLINTIIGNSPQETEKQMDESYGKIPQKLDEFQQKLKQLKIKNWEDFFNATGCSQNFKSKILINIDNWISECVERSNKKGKKYQKR